VELGRYTLVGPMSRNSRPPGFDMTYKPLTSVTFGAPLSTRVPSLVYLAMATAVVLFVVMGSLSSNDSWAFRYITQERILSARTLAAILLASAVASVVRARMRGVIVHPEGLEARDILGVGWPRVRRFAWPQIDKIVLDAGKSIALDLWDGRREFLPAVGDRDQLAAVLEQVAVARAIPISGGTGFFDPPEVD
jgi:hypothetical protein